MATGFTPSAARSLAYLPQNSAHTMYGTVGGGTQFDPNLYAQLLMTGIALDTQNGGASAAPVDTRSVSRAQLARQSLKAKSAGTAGTNNALIQQLLREYTASQAAANRANIGRYNSILTGYDRRIADARRTLAGMGGQSRLDIEQAGKEAKATKGQDIVSRGLAGTTVKQSVERGVDQDVQAALARLDESLRRERLGYETQLSGERLGFMERRTDEQPDLTQMITLLAALGAA